MKKTLMAIGLGYLGYSLYNKYGKNNPQVNNFVNDLGRKVKDTINSVSSNLSPAGATPNRFEPQIESQISRREGLTDELKVGIND